MHRADHDGQLVITDVPGCQVVAILLPALASRLTPAVDEREVDVAGQDQLTQFVDAARLHFDPCFTEREPPTGSAIRGGSGVRRWPGVPATRIRLASEDRAREPNSRSSLAACITLRAYLARISPSSVSFEPVGERSSSRRPSLRSIALIRVLAAGWERLCACAAFPHAATTLHRQQQVEVGELRHLGRKHHWFDPLALKPSAHGAL